LDRRDRKDLKIIEALSKVTDFYRLNPEQKKGELK